MSVQRVFERTAVIDDYVNRAKGSFGDMGTIRAGIDGNLVILTGDMKNGLVNEDFRFHALHFDGRDFPAVNPFALYRPAFEKYSQLEQQFSHQKFSLRKPPVKAMFNMSSSQQKRLPASMWKPFHKSTKRIRGNSGGYFLRLTT